MSEISSLEDRPTTGNASVGGAGPDKNGGPDSATLNQRARSGIKLLLGRQFLLQILTFGGGVILARVLDPAAFGLYAIATFVVTTIALFGDFGLSPLLIQRKEEIAPLDLQVGFTLQQIITTAVVAILWFTAPSLATLYPKAPPETVWLIRALAFTLYLSSWRTMSALQLERHMSYGAMARVEIVEGTLYQALAVILALAGWGVWSFIWAAVARGVVGGLLLYAASPWKVQFRFDRKVARDILRFGFPFQLQMLSNQLSNWVTPLFVGSLIGPTAVGYLTWASSNGKKPLLLVDNVMRVAFPHFSRLQANPVEMERLMGRYLAWLLVPSGLWLGVLLTAGQPIVETIYTAKWSAAVPALILSAAALFFDVFGWVIATGLNSVGKVHFITRIALLRSVAHLVLSIPFVYFFGYNGVPSALLIASALSIPWIVQGLAPGAAGRLYSAIAWMILPLTVSIALGSAVHSVAVAALPRAIITGGLVTVVYGLLIWVRSPEWFKQPLLRAIRSTLA